MAADDDSWCYDDDDWDSELLDYLEELAELRSRGLHGSWRGVLVTTVAAKEEYL